MSAKTWIFTAGLVLAGSVHASEKRICYRKNELETRILSLTIDENVIHAEGLRAPARGSWTFDAAPDARLPTQVLGKDSVHMHEENGSAALIVDSIKEIKRIFLIDPPRNVQLSLECAIESTASSAP